MTIWERIKSWLGTAAGLIIFVLGILLYRKSEENKTLEAQLENNKADKAIDGVLNDEDKKKQAADKLSAKYRAMYDKYMGGTPKKPDV